MIAGGAIARLPITSKIAYSVSAALHTLTLLAVSSVSSSIKKSVSVGWLAQSQLIASRLISNSFIRAVSGSVISLASAKKSGLKISAVTSGSVALLKKSSSRKVSATSGIGSLLTKKSIKQTASGSALSALISFSGLSLYSAISSSISLLPTLKKSSVRSLVSALSQSPSRSKLVRKSASSISTSIPKIIRSVSINRAAQSGAVGYVTVSRLLIGNITATLSSISESTRFTLKNSLASNGIGASVKKSSSRVMLASSVSNPLLVKLSTHSILTSVSGLSLIESSLAIIRELSSVTFASASSLKSINKSPLALSLTYPAFSVGNASLSTIVAGSVSMSATSTSKATLLIRKLLTMRLTKSVSLASNVTRSIKWLSSS